MDLQERDRKERAQSPQMPRPPGLDNLEQSSGVDSAKVVTRMTASIRHGCVAPSIFTK